jgi:hypothetical protein
MTKSETNNFAIPIARIDRRRFAGGLMASTLVLHTSVHAGGYAGKPKQSLIEQLAERFPSLYPQFQTALEVVAEVGDPLEVGQGPHGQQRIVPITGGEFRGPGLAGKVLPGGADRQTSRADGIRELDAAYELQADDGTVLMVRNRVIVDAERPSAGEPRYVRSVVIVTAPKGPHDWLNRRVIIGTLHSLRPAQPRVFLRFHIVQ